MVREASAVVGYICAKEEDKGQKEEEMNSVLEGKLNHNFIGLITMERLIESILSITIMDEKDVDRCHHNESCATSMNHSHYSGNGHLNMKQVGDEIDHSMDLSM